MNLAERMKIVPVILSPTDFGATADCDSINMKDFHKATFIFNFGACTGDVTFTPKCGATEGAKTTAVPFSYALGGAAIGTAVAGSTASCDVLGATGAHASTIALTCTTKMVVLEIDASSMTDAQPWLTVTIAATAGIASAVAILQPRFTGNRSATCLK